MRILILTFFYPPDLSAGSFRMGALVEQLLARLPAGAKVDVLTTKPNRYASFDVDSCETEEYGPLTIQRIPLPPHKSGMFDQARAFLTYYRSAIKRSKGIEYDLVFATSSKLMTAFLGARIATRKRIPLYLDIRDIFLDTIKDVFPGWKGRLLMPFLSRIERYSINRAAQLNLVSEGFKPYFTQRYPNIPTHYFTNGIDDSFLNEHWLSEHTEHREPIQILYAGNIGEGQGLHRIVPQLSALAGNRFKFTIVGDGGRKDRLVQEIRNTPGAVVELLAPVDRTTLINLYKNCDILFLHLNDYDAFAKVLPSKLFEYAATGKPILAGVGGYPAEFLRSQVENCQVFPPCMADAGLKAIESLTKVHTPRLEFIEKYARKGIMGRMAETIAIMGTGHNQVV